MPYKVVKSGDKYQVRKKDDNKIMGTHESRKKALNQIKAIYANEKQASYDAIKDFIKQAAMSPIEAINLLNQVQNTEGNIKKDYDDTIKNKIWNFIIPELVGKDMLLEKDLQVKDDYQQDKFIENSLEYELHNYFANRALTDMKTDASPDFLEQLAQLQQLNQMQYMNKTPPADMSADDILEILGGLQI